METKPLIVERSYNAPIEKVWKAITDRDQMKEWYFELKEFKAEKGFKFQFTDCSGHFYFYSFHFTAPFLVQSA
ncbi:SRPBCC domain-containing protein [Pedobacter heparinus]|uniref:SRPBCC family protein n=1 Tax=Pedobacter heparinus TaxID=984 RepID=UPI00292CE239|nr:SRPBCC domain-containing protein [Pedobacter heparinus]